MTEQELVTRCASEIQHSVGHSKHISCTTLCYHWRLIVIPQWQGLGGSFGLNFYIFAQPPASDIDSTCLHPERTRRY